MRHRPSRLDLLVLLVLSCAILPASAGDLRVQGQLISEATSGPPLAVSSADLVPNLNADKLDGFGIGDFAVEGSGVGVHYKNLVGVPGEEIDQDCAVNTGCFAGDTPGFPVTITEPGSYRLAGNLSVATAVSAISVLADHVTLDLAGFVIEGNETGEHGVVGDGRRNVEVRNGTVRRFSGNGIRGLGSGTSGHRVMHVRSELNGSHGIFFNDGVGFYVAHSIASGNGTVTSADGIRILFSGTIVHSQAHDNSRTGIQTGLFGPGSVIAYNAVSGNGRNGIGGQSATVIGNSSNQNGRTGISCQAALVKNNTVFINNQDGSSSDAGILARSGCQILENNLHNNQVSSITVPGSDSGVVIENNRLAGSTRGLWLLSDGNFYANNRATNNTTDYDIASGNTDGGGNISY